MSKTIEAKFVKLRYVPAETYIETGVKDNKRPKEALGGGNGTFVYLGDKSKLLLILRIDGKDKPIKVNIIKAVRKINNRKRITAKLIKILSDKLKNEEIFVTKDYDKYKLANKDILRITPKKEDVTQLRLL